MFPNQRKSIGVFIKGNEYLLSLDYRDPKSFSEALEDTVNELATTDDQWNQLLAAPPAYDRTKLLDVKHAICEALAIKYDELPPPEESKPESEVSVTELEPATGTGSSEPTPNT